MKKPNLTLVINQNAEFSDSQAGLDQGKRYIVTPCDSSVNALAAADNKDNKNIQVHACVKTTFEDVEKPVGDKDFFKATVGSRAFKDCNILSATQKKAAMGQFFELWWTPGEERPATKDREAYTPKIWHSKEYKFDEEG